MPWTMVLTLCAGTALHVLSHGRTHAEMCTESDRWCMCWRRQHSTSRGTWKGDLTHCRPPASSVCSLALDGAAAPSASPPPSVPLSAPLSAGLLPGRRRVNLTVSVASFASSSHADETSTIQAESSSAGAAAVCFRRCHTAGACDRAGANCWADSFVLACKYQHCRGASCVPASYQLRHVLRSTALHLPPVASPSLCSHLDRQTRMKRRA